MQTLVCQVDHIPGISGICGFSHSDDTGSGETCPVNFACHEKTCQVFFVFCFLFFVFVFVFIFYFPPPFFYLRLFFFSLSLLVVTQIRGHIEGSSSPLSTTARALSFLSREYFSSFFPRRLRVELCLPTLGALSS